MVFFYFCEILHHKNLIYRNLMIILICRDADDAVQDLDGKDLQGGRVRVELARPPGRDRDRDRGGRGFGGRSPPRRGSRPGPKTDYRIVVENLSSRTSWQVNAEIYKKPSAETIPLKSLVSSGLERLLPVCGGNFLCQRSLAEVGRRTRGIRLQKSHGIRSGPQGKHLD